MPTPVEIKVFNIARTQVDREEVERWLRFIGVSEDYELPPEFGEGAVTHPALLIALAAKRCYKSFEVGLNENVTRIRTEFGEYLDNVMASGHGSVLEHAVFTFGIEGVSRVFTGEMNRHRAGWAISESSMRFVRYSKSIPFWMPNSISGKDALDDVQLRYMYETDLSEMGVGGNCLELENLDEKKHATRVIFEQAFRSQEHAYRIMEAIWADELAPTSKFQGKKEITSLMRRIIGMGVATGGVWSGNVRALRHVLTMRCSPQAEEEILHVFSQVAKYMRDKEPMLFGDFYQVDNKYWLPKYLKV